MEMARTEIFFSYYMNKMCKDASLLIGKFSLLDHRVTFNIFW